MDTNDATIVASDMQSGSIAYAKGQKVTAIRKGVITEKQYKKITGEDYNK